MEQVLAFWSDGLANSYISAPPAERVGLDELKKVYAMHTDVKVVMVRGSVSGSIGPPRWSTATATLSLNGQTVDKMSVVGTATLIERNGAWKVAGPEEWQGQQSVDPPDVLRDDDAPSRVRPGGSLRC